MANDDRSILELISQKIKKEFKISGSVVINGHGPAWRYMVTGSEAQKLAKFIVKAIEENVPILRKLYDLLSDYELIRPEKWVRIKRSSIYVFNQRKVEFGGLTWSAHFKNNHIFLSVETTDAKYAKEIVEKMKTRGINVTLTKYTKRKDNKIRYEVLINWFVLQRYLCDQELRSQLIQVAINAIESCEIRRKLGKIKSDCYAKQWLERLTNEQWLKENIGCSE